MKDNHPVRGLEVLCATINAAVDLEREEGKAALSGILLPLGFHSILLRYDGSDALAGHRHSPAKDAGLNAASVAQLMSLCRMSSVRPAEVSGAEGGMLVLLGTPSPLASAKDAGRG